MNFCFKCADTLCKMNEIKTFVESRTKIPTSQLNPRAPEFFPKQMQVKTSNVVEIYRNPMLEMSSSTYASYCYNDSYSLDNSLSSISSYKSTCSNFSYGIFCDEILSASSAKNVIERNDLPGNTYFTQTFQKDETKVRWIDLLDDSYEKFEENEPKSKEIYDDYDEDEPKSDEIYDDEEEQDPESSSEAVFFITLG